MRLFLFWTFGIKGTPQQLNGGVMNKENHLVEYKRELSETFERSVIAFLNSTGGHIYIGVNDDGSVYGVKDIDHVQRQVADRILNNIKPNAIGLFEVVTEEKDNKNIVHVAISGGEHYACQDYSYGTHRKAPGRSCCLARGCNQCRCSQ